MSRKAGAFSSWHVGVAAEAVTAAQFARVGLDVSVQYGANQPEYDLVIVRGERLFKVSVKGSQDGSWGLTQSYLKRADYQKAIDVWLANHHRKTIFAFVQFKDVPLDALPRVYLATPGEVARRLRDSAGGRGDTILYENHTWGPRAQAKGTTDRIPVSWVFSKERVDHLLSQG
jgi:hypothetical protein